MDRVDKNLRLSRGSGIIRPPGGESVCVIGVGGIGSNAVHMLASMGITDFEVVDPDLVGEENIFPGFFRMADDGARKVDVMWHYATDMGGITPITVEVRCGDCGGDGLKGCAWCGDTPAFLHDPSCDAECLSCHEQLLRDL